MSDHRKITFHGSGVISRPRADGRIVYSIRYWWNGERITEKVGYTIEQARARLDSRLESIKKDVDYVPEPIKKRQKRERGEVEKAARRRDATAFSELVKVYREHLVPTKQDRVWQESLIKLVEAEFGKLKLAEVTPERVEAWRAKLKRSGASAGTIRKYIYFLSGMFRQTAKVPAGRALASDNPCRLVMLPDEPEGLKKFLSVDQAKALLEAAQDDPVMFRWAFLILRTGMRVEEAGGLRWRDVSLTSGEIKIHDTKTGKPRRVEAGEELLPRLVDWFKNDDAQPDDPVIGQVFASIPHKRWRALFKEAEVPWGMGRDGFTPRNLRTTFCMLAFQNGAQPAELVEQTGHSIATLMSYYAEANREARQRAVNSMPALIENPVPAAGTRSTSASAIKQYRKRTGKRP